MSGYIPEIRFEKKYEDDNIVVVIEPLSRTAFIEVMPFLSEAQTEKGSMAVYDAACKVLDTHIKSIEGLKNQNGDPITKDEFLGKVYFVDLVTAVFQKLIEESSLGKMMKTG